MMKDLFQKYRKIRVACKEGVSDERHEEIGNLSMGLVVSLFGFFVTGTFLSSFYYPQLWIMSMLLVNLFLVSSKTLNELQP
jgi:uncharacterized protein (DUF983 family)